MNSKKFLDQLGVIALISKIKQALNGKQNVDMVVTIAQSGNAYSCDTSIADIVAAHDAGRDVYAVLPPVSNGSSTKIKLVEVQNYGSGTVMMVSFGGIINNGTNNVLYSVSGTRQNNLDVWSVSQKTMQEKLVSGTSIKTVNGNTLLGSGDVTINGSERVTATWDASASAYTYESAVDVDTMYQSFYSQGKVLELHLVNGNYNGLVLTCHGGYTSNNERHLKFSGSGDGKLIEADVVGTAVTVSYEDINAISGALYGKQDTIGLNNKVDADFVEYRGADTSRLGNGDSMTEALHVLDTAITNLGTPNEIASITTQESSASGGNNVVTITDTDGTVTSFNVKNGKDGKDGADGADGVSLGEIALVQTTGDSEESVMSQKAVTEELQTVSYIYKTPTYLQGRLCYYKLADYPQLDPRTADGISIAFNVDRYTTKRCMMFAILNPNASVNQGFATRYFGLAALDGAFRFGFFSSYWNITTGGYSFGIIKGHYVITYNFKTGVCKCYRNGVLSYNQTPSSWDEQSMIRDYFNNCTHITLNAIPRSGRVKQSGIALFGRELTEETVKDLYGNGVDTIKTELISNNLKAYNLSPIYPSWQIQIFSRYATTSTAADGGVNITQKGSAETNWQQFGFKGLSGFINNATLEFDFELISGSIKYVGGNYDRTWHGNSTSNYYAKNVYTITDENENDVTYSDLAIGHVYHVIANPDFIASGTINSNGDLNHFIFSGCSADCIIHIKPTLKVTEQGAALECSINTYAGTYWELANGIKLPLNTTTIIYSTESLYVGTDTYISNTVIYSSSISPQFNGQIAVDTTNGKVYIGYLTGTGGTWKQVSN